MQQNNNNPPQQTIQQQSISAALQNLDIMEQRLCSTIDRMRHDLLVIAEQLQQPQ